MESLSQLWVGAQNSGLGSSLSAELPVPLEEEEEKELGPVYAQLAM